jgi:uncharacterized protein YbgA (DUF1722 family)/uncharacterized protein YbbK (DUF523 family)
MIKHNYISLPIQVGISTCLLGEKVRFDGGHKKDRYLTDVLSNYFEFVATCPEIEIGMGVPRDSVRLVNTSNSIRMIGPKTNTDWTDKMVSYSEKLVKKFSASNLSGYILKSDSPTCGMERVRIYNPSGIPNKNGRGLFAEALIKSNPYLPVEEEGRLNDAKIRENFITRVFSYHRLQNLINDNFSRGSLVEFHTMYKYQLMAHSIKHYELLGRLVADAKKYPLKEVAEKYTGLFMEALSIKTTTKKNVNVLHHIFGYLKEYLTPTDKQSILNVIEDYHKELVPLIVPITLLKHYVEKRNIEYIKVQVYLNPHPKELMLRNHV